MLSTHLVSLLRYQTPRNTKSERNRKRTTRQLVTAARARALETKMRCAELTVTWTPSTNKQWNIRRLRARTQLASIRDSRRRGLRVLLKLLFVRCTANAVGNVAGSTNEFGKCCLYTVSDTCSDT